MSVRCAARSIVLFLLAPLMALATMAFFGAGPVALIAVLGSQHGLEMAGSVLLVQGVVSLARALVPVRSRTICRTQLVAAIERDDDDEAARVVRVAIGAEVGAAVLATLLVLAASPVLAETVLGGAVPWWLLVLASGGPLAWSIGLVSSEIVLAARRTEIQPLLSGLVGLVAMLLATIVAIVLSTSLPDLVISAVVATAALALGMLIVASRVFARRVGRSWLAPVSGSSAPRGELLRATFTGWGTWLDGIALAAAIPVLGWQAGPAEVPLYAAAIMLQALLTWYGMFPAAIGTTSLARRVARSFAFAAVTVVVSWSAGPWLYELLYPAALSEGAPLLLILCWHGVSVAALPFRSSSSPKARPAHAQWVLAAGAAVFAFLLWLLVPSHGVIGCAYAWVGHALTQTALTAFAWAISHDRHAPPLDAG